MQAENTHRNSYLNQATQENTCHNFPTPQNPEIEFQTQKNPSIILVGTRDEPLTTFAWEAIVTLSVSEYYILFEVLIQAYCLAKINTLS